MNNSDKKAGPKFKSSFNKSKSISDAMDDLEMGRSISKPKKSIDTIENRISKNPNTNLNNEDIDYYLNDFEMDKINSESLNMDGINLEDLENPKSNTIDNNIDKFKSTSDEEFNEIFISPNEGDIKDDIEDISYLNPNKKLEGFILDEDPLEVPINEKSEYNDFKNLKSINNSYSKSSKDSKSFKNSLKSIFDSKSKIFAILGIILGLFIIIYGFMSFANVSERVIDNVLLGEAGSWSIIIILIGLIIILLDVFFFVYYKKSLSDTKINNTQIKNTFDTIDKIKSIDSDYYDDEPSISTSIFKDLLNGNDDEESQEYNLNSNFKDEILNSDSINLKKSVNDKMANISKEDDDSFNDKINNSVFREEDSNV